MQLLIRLWSRRVPLPQRKSPLTRADVGKAFNTTFSGTLVVGEASGQPLDVFIAGDSAEGTSAVSEFVAAAGMRPHRRRRARRRRRAHGAGDDTLDRLVKVLDKFAATDQMTM
ncbi:hypothetical protein [Arthrobacter sp. FW306-04-A]|uniref:hypothetical protein n=1 Tax=Arthrobacter sp. FW306-04-A TaxID=2879619 RepID=UPI0037C1AA0D|nr:hypothetical protein LFT43_04955 [Arthrobacter sp. FW306-04-A]